MTKRKKQITSTHNCKVTASAKSGRPLWLWLAAFVTEYQRGPLTPEPQANCVNGVGEPVS